MAPALRKKAPFFCRNLKCLKPLTEADGALCVPCAKVDSDARAALLLKPIHPEAVANAATPTEPRWLTESSWPLWPQ